MAFLQVSFFSQTLQMGCSMNIILPEATYGIGVNAKNINKEMPVLYLLHGLSDDHTIWSRRTAIERYAMTNSLAVVMPCAARSFYTNEIHGGKYFDFVSQELPAIVSQMFKVSNKRENTFVAGLSMGGYGALKLALNYPQNFAAAASFSAVTDVMSFLNDNNREEILHNVFGSKQRILENNDDLFSIVEKFQDTSKLPEIMLACGCDDELYPQHTKFAAALKSRNIDFYRRDDPGYAHQWDYWDNMIKIAIDWMLKDRLK